MSKFEVGKTYETRSPGDHNCVISARIVKRTDKTVTFVEFSRHFPGRDEAPKVARVREWEGVERFDPWGRYSMSPTMAADRAVQA